MESKNPNPQSDLNVTPLLRSIAGELVSRSLAILELEAQIEDVRERDGDHGPELDLLVADLATQRRELRHAENELKRLGWKRDKKRPLRFFSAERPEEEEWQLQGTGFYRSLDAAPSD